MDWDKLRVFHAVAEAGSFTHAGATLNLSQSAVSRQISALEESLRVTLFHRHARGLMLTEQGELLYRTAREVVSRMAMTEAMLTDSKDSPQGPLTVTATISFGTVWLTPRIVAFCDRYPDISLNLLLDDREVDLSMREADIAIRIAPPRQPDLIRRQLMTVNFYAYASPEYLKKRGTPQVINDLDHHHIVVYGEGPLSQLIDSNWLLKVGDDQTSPRRPSLKINNIFGLLRAVESDLGIAALPKYIIPDDTNVVRILPELQSPSLTAYLLYPEELRHSKRITVFRDFLLEEVSRWES